ncbi:MlaD family protein [Haloechinothrix alba]|nr:MlaD family protein [Haloechinothrix alba]
MPLKSMVGVSALAVAVLGVGGIAASSGADGDNTVVAMFEDANPLAAGNSVKIDGAKVGEVRSLELEQGQARVEMELDDSVLPLHEDAAAEIRPVSLLGERYIALDPGSDDADYMEGESLISGERTGSATDLDQVLDTLDDPTSAGLSALLTTLGEGVAGQGENVDELISTLTPSLEEIDSVATTLDGQTATLKRLVERVGPVADAIAGQEGTELDRLLEATDQSLSTVASNREALEQTIHQLPDTMVRAREELAQLEGVSDGATDILRSVRPVTEDLDSISQELEVFADASGPALNEITPVLEKANALLDQAGPAVEALQPGTRDLATVSSSARPIAEEAISHLSELMDFVGGWSKATSSRDGLSHYFRGLAVMTPDSLLTTGKGVAPSEVGDTVPKSPIEDPPNLGVPPLGEETLDNGDTDSNDASPENGATGLNESQEEALLDQLLGNGKGES